MLICEVNSYFPGLSSTRGSRNQGIDSPICAALPSGPVSRTQSSFTRPMCPREKPAEDLDPHRLQGTWIMHGANAASLRPPTSTTCQHRQQEERSTEEVRHTGKMFGGCRGEEEGRGVGRGLWGAEKRGRDTEKRTGLGKEKRERTGYCRGDRKGENLKESEEGSGKETGE